MKIPYKSTPIRPVGKTIRHLKSNELEIGQIICSDENSNHVYKVINEEFVSAIARIDQYGEIELLGKLIYPIRGDKWVETEASRFLDKKSRREDLLIELGII